MRTRRATPRPRVASGAAAAALLLACACGRPAIESPDAEPPPPVEARAGVDRAVATTGDVITYRVVVDHDAGLEVVLPEPGAEIAGFRIIDAGSEPVRESGGRRVEERWYRLRADLVGSYVLPPLVVGYGPPGGGEEARQTVETSPIFVEVESVLPADGAAEDIRDIKPPRRERRRWPWPWIVAAVLATAAAVAVLAWLRRRRARRVTPPVPAHELAFAALDELRRTDFDDPRAVRRFHFAISGAVRAYVEGRFGLNATDLTSEEIVGGLSRLAELGDEQAAELCRFLADTDLVKFAEHWPTQAEIEATYERALGFVESTRPRPELEAA